MNAGEGNRPGMLMVCTRVCGMCVPVCTSIALLVLQAHGRRTNLLDIYPRECASSSLLRLLDEVLHIDTIMDL